MRWIVSALLVVAFSLAARSASAQETAKYGTCQVTWQGTGTLAHVVVGVVEYQGQTATCPIWPDSTGMQFFFFCAPGVKGTACHPTVRFSAAELVGLYQAFVSALDTGRPALIFTDFISNTQVPEYAIFMRQ
jgi:hypothetical protein